MSSINKVVIPLNSVFSVDAFFSVLLRTINPLWFSKGRKLLPQTLALEGRLEMVESGTLPAFQDEVRGLEYSEVMPQPTRYLVVDLRINLGFSEALTLCPLPQYLLLWLET